mmetsp:Transcript_36371/g.88500  ORF Transcript_36371/g.88500 Transcript_36371/m.88500 type:complete len:89 (+) Transcript_36371:43-309(+)
MCCLSLLRSHLLTLRPAPPHVALCASRLAPRASALRLLVPPRAPSCHLRSTRPCVLSLLPAIALLTSRPALPRLVFAPRVSRLEPRAS